MIPFVRSVAFLALVGLSSSSFAQLPDTTPPSFTGTPTILPNTNPAAPLTAQITVTTDEPTLIDLHLQEPTRGWRLTPSPAFATSHVLPLVGLHPNQNYQIRVSVRDAAGNRTQWTSSIPYTTPPLPANFPPFRVTAATPSRMEPGVTLTALRWSSPTISGTGTYCVYLDNVGEVVWLYQTTISFRDVLRMRNGNLLSNANNRLAQEIDLYGNVVRQWWAARLGMAGAPAGAIPVDCDSFHHEFHELPNGDFLALSTELRVLPNYPSSEVDPTQTVPTANVVGDVLVEFRRDGTIVRELKAFDLIDPYRLCYGSLLNIYNTLYATSTHSWSHGNSAIHDPSDDTWVISFRHQDAVVKVRRSDHSIVWIHGPHERWNAPWSQYLLTPTGSPFQWNFHQHSPDFSSGNQLTMYDNGNFRVVPPATAAPAATWFSRIVRFVVDPVTMTTQQVLSYDEGGTFFSGQFGDADPLATTSNLLIVDGAKPITPTSTTQYSRIFELTTTLPHEKVYEVIVNDPTLPVTNPYSWNVYRAQRYSYIYAFQ